MSPSQYTSESALDFVSLELVQALLAVRHRPIVVDDPPDSVSGLVANLFVLEYEGKLLERLANGFDEEEVWILSDERYTSSAVPLTDENDLECKKTAIRD